MLCRLLVLLLSLSFTHAVNHHVRAGATGTADGTDWTNAYTDLPATLTRGDTYYIADGSYVVYDFDDADSGTTLINILKAVETAHGTDTGWNSTYGDGQAIWPGDMIIDVGYINFDGIVGSGISGHGFKIATVGGQKGFRLNTTFAIPFRVGSTIAHTEIAGSGLDTEVANDGIFCFLTSDLALQYLYIHDMGRTQIFTSFCDRITMEYSVLARNSNSPSQHSEGWAGQGGQGNIIRYNRFEDIEGTGIIIILSRGANFRGADNWEIYGNVFWQTPATTRGGMGNGAIAVINFEPANNWQIYNNTFVNIPSLSSRISFFESVGSGHLIHNNLWLDSATADHNGNYTADFNYYINTASISETNGQVDSSGDPFTDSANGDFTLSASTDAGLTLASPYNVDPNGLVRGVDGVWDRGAYELFNPTGADNFVREFTGTITAITDSSSFLPAEIEVGDSVTGTFCYTTTASDRDNAAEWGDYRFNSAPDTLIFTVEGKTWQPLDIFNLRVLARNGSPSDGLTVLLRGIDMPVGLDSSENPNHSFMQFTLIDTDASVLVDDSLPTSLTLSDWEQGAIDVLVTHNITTGAYYRILVETILTLEAP